MTKRPANTASKSKAASRALAERQKIVALASGVRLPYEPSSFTVEQLREAIAAVRK